MEWLKRGAGVVGLFVPLKHFILGDACKAKTCVLSSAPSGSGRKKDQVPGRPSGGNADEEAGDKTSPL